jgi:hypothetical protein
MAVCVKYTPCALGTKVRRRRRRRLVTQTINPIVRKLLDSIFHVLRYSYAGSSVKLPTQGV